MAQSFREHHRSPAFPQLGHARRRHAQESANVNTDPADMARHQEKSQYRVPADFEPSSPFVQ